MNVLRDQNLFSLSINSHGNYFTCVVISVIAVSIFILLCSDCGGLFLRHTQTGKCITPLEELVYDAPNDAIPYYVVLTDNCLNDTAQFRYLDKPLLFNIEKQGTLWSPGHPAYMSRWWVYKGVHPSRISGAMSSLNYLKQTAAGSLFLYNWDVCAQPNSSNYILRETCGNTTEQEFTFGK
jgi:hypothetical protein